MKGHQPTNRSGLRRKGVALLSLAAVLTLGLAACSSDKAADTTTAAANTTAATATAAPDTAAVADSAAPDTAAADTVAATETTAAAAVANGKATKVALMYDVTGRGDKGFADSAAAGLDMAKAKLNIVATESETKNGGNDLPDRMKLQVDNGNDLIIAVGFSWADEVAKQAANSPSTHFALVDASVDAPNVAGLLFAEDQGSYIVGAAAALKSKSGKLGFIGGVETDLIKKFLAGFSAGAKSINPNVTIEAKYISQPPDFSGFNDPQKGKEIAAAMYSGGIDVVYHAAGASGAGLFQAAKESGKAPGDIWAIGVNVDETVTVPADQRPYILTSMLKNLDVAVEKVIEDQAAGKFTGGNKVFNLANNGVGYATTGGHLDDIKGRLEKIKADIISGAITVPSA